MPKRPDQPGSRATGLAEAIGKRHPFEMPEQEAYLNLVRTAGLMADDFARLFKAHGLSETAYNVLRILRHGPDEGLPCLQVADRLVRRMPDITRLTDRLRDRGLVDRHRDPTDRRVIRLTLTDAGRELVDDLNEPVRELHRRQMGHLSERQLASLSRLLEKARDHDEAE
ncbi:MAG: MarR family transcriptional regulator [Planctomycetota bacterium]